MTQKKYCSKIIICLLLIFAFLFPLGTNIVFADQTTLNIGTLISDFSDGTPNDQEITDDLGFSFYDEETWTPSSFTGNEDNELISNDTFPYNSTDEDEKNVDIVKVIDFESLEEDESFYYGTVSKQYSELSNSSIDNNALLFLTSEQKVLGIETQLTIPAQSIYVLSFKVSVRAKTNSYGINAKIIHKDKDNNDVIDAIPGIKTISTSYTTYYFLIRGNEYTDKELTLLLLWGNISKSGEIYSSSKEKGYAAVSSFQMFSVNYNQYKDLSSTTTNNKQVNLYSTNPSNTFVPNGYFSLAANQLWNISQSNELNDFIPSDWTQTTAETNPANRVAHYGIIDVNSSAFTNRMTELGLNLINPENHISSINNNVLLLLNETTTYQTITSSEFTLTKNKYYEISFKFNTPALKSSADAETNSLNFYITNTEGGTVYSREDMFSYTEWSEDANEWTTFRVFIKAPTTADKKVKFIIKLGTEDATKEGYAYIDDVQLISKLNESNIYINNDEDTFILKGEEGSETSYLETGTMLSFTDLLQLDETNETNSSLATYDYTTQTPPVDDDNDDNSDDNGDDADETDSTALTYLWYVIPSILMALCTIMGLVIFYAKKIKSKIKIPAKKKKNSYDRKRTLEKQISDREKAELKNNANLEKELNKVNSQIEKLEAQYEKAKSNPLKLGEYVKKRERLQNQQTKLIEKINNKNK